MTTPTQTVLDAILSSIGAAASYNRNVQVAPSVILWTDKDRQWESLLPRLRTMLPILTLGSYNPGQRIGPAIWMRCMIARSLPDTTLPENAIPVLYLPGVSRADLRAIEECPDDLKPLAELQYRGVFWSQKNGKDWTIAAFLQSADGGLGIPVAGDNGTREALQRTLLRLADQSVEHLRDNTPLNAARCYGLVNLDPVPSVLRWIESPTDFRQQQSVEEWAAFEHICSDSFGFDPVSDTPITAAAMLGSREGQWGPAWTRFAEAPNHYPGIPLALRQARLTLAAGLFFDPSSWPQENDVREGELRKALLGLKDLTPLEACRKIRELEQLHGERRQWVWATLSRAPLAMALRHLADLAGAVQIAATGASAEAMAETYAVGGWKADAASLDSLSEVTSQPDAEAVKAAVRALYFTWLRDSAERFQQLASSHPWPQPATGPGAAGCCIVFVDGLRYDVGKRLAELLQSAGSRVEVGWRFAAVPTVTATAKPAVSPAASSFGPGAGFTPAVLTDRAAVNVIVLRREMEKLGFAILQGDDAGDPAGKAWTECGTLDSYGHAQGWKLARRTTEVNAEISERIGALIEAGWKEVQVVTDHGWLLMPGGLPKTDLPEYLTELRKGRCARLKPGSNVDQLTMPWRWDPDVRVALAPGISCFEAGKEYEHGGLSLQECVTPILTVKSAAAAAQPVSVVDLKWKGLRCQVTFENVRAGLTVDLRTKPGDPASSLVQGGKPVPEQGQASLAIEDDSTEGHAAVVVVVGDGARVIAQVPTIVGG